MVVKFSLRRDKKSSKTELIPVLVTVYYSGNRIRKSVPNVKVKENDWNEFTQRIIPSKKKDEYNFAHEFNHELDSLKSKLSSYWGRCLINQCEPTKVEISNIIENKESNVEFRQDLISCFESYIDQNRSHRAKRTIIGYTTTLNLLKQYVQSKSTQISLDDIDLKFFDDFRNYCFEERGFLNNYFAKIINNIKAFMVWAEDRELHTNRTYLKFKAHEENIEVIYLTKEELFHLYNFDFESDRLSRIRDIYCFACFTGLRYSDLANLKSSHIYDDYLKLNVEKTREKDQKVPLSKYALSILETYKGTRHYPLPMISSQKLNEYIKEACKVAGINTPITISRYSGKSKIEKTVPKYELLTLHTGRKTFVTNSLVLGMNQMIVRSITGHKSDSAFRKYVKVADEVKNSELSKYWNNID